MWVWVWLVCRRVCGLSVVCVACVCMCGLCVVGGREVWQLSVICYPIRQSLGGLLFWAPSALRF